MSDYSELKRLSELAIDEGVESGQRWPQEDDWFEPDLISAEMDYVKAASPIAVLALIAENESLRKDAERFAYIERDADSGMSKIYGDDWVTVIDAAMSQGEQS